MNTVNIILGIILILTFFGMVWYCVKGYNLMVGFFIMSVLWVAIALIGNAISPNPAMDGKSIIDVLTNVFQTGPENYGKSILVNIFFGAFFGRVLIDTGIAATLIRKVVELGGDKPRITMALLCTVTAIVFYIHDRNWTSYFYCCNRITYYAISRNSFSNCHVLIYGFHYGRYFF